MPKAYTPDQVAEMLQLSKNTVYQMIQRGEIAAKKFGKVYRISPVSLSFLFNGLDYDLYLKEQEDLKYMAQINDAISDVRKTLK